MKLAHVVAAVALCAVPGTAFAITISNPAQLAAAWKTARGGEVFDLAPGNYGALNFSSRTFAAPVTFRSADPSRPAVFGRTTINSVAGISFNGVEFANPLGRTDALWTPAVQVNSSSRISFSSVSVHGSLDGNAANDGFGIVTRGSSGITVSNSRFTQLTRAATFGTSSDLTLTGNTVSHIRAEGFNFAQVQNVRITGNRFSDFHTSAADHPDAIQFWTAGTNQPSRNILVSGNLVVGGATGRMQGIFITGGAGALRYQNVTVTNNTLVGTAWHGITVMGADGVAITGNKVVTVADSSVKTAWIMVSDVTGTMKGNFAKQFISQGSPALVSANNVANAIGAAAADTAIAVWYTTHQLPLPGQQQASTNNTAAPPTTTNAAFTVPTPTPDTSVPVNGNLFQPNALNTASVPTNSGTGFDNANNLQRNLSGGNVVVEGDLLSAVPEPATWVQMLAGFGAIGWMIRRSRSRRRVQVAVG